nr:condensin complex subunit 2-like [Nomia melanderi]
MATDIDKNEKELSNDPLLGSSSSLLRRKSMLLRNVSVLSENNDEEERLARRLDINVVTKTSTNDKRRSLGLSFLTHMSPPEISNRITECIKLSTENKINIKNAFNLEMIDFMTYMIKKKDDNMCNLQVASTSLDVSTKIYGYRVDGVHTEILKLIGGLDKQEDDAGSNDNQENDSIDPEHQLKGSKNQKKQKKKSKKQILSSVESLKGSIEILKPTPWLMGDDDTQTADTLYQVALPNHANSRFNLHLYNDVIVDAVENTKDIKKDEATVIKVNVSGLIICPPMEEFEFLNWIDDNEKEENEIQENRETENKFQFDLDASLPSEDEVIQTSINLLDIDDDEENVEKHVQKEVEKIVDFRKVVTNTELTKTSEYSFIHRNMNIHWAGPSHWKINNFKKPVTGSKIIEACPQGQGRKKKEIELCYDDDAKKAVMPKFVLNRSGRIEIRSTESEWQEAMVTLPRDVHYKIASTAKLYLHELITISSENKDNLDTTQVFDNIDIYNYDNENDTSNYCPNVPVEDYEVNENNVDSDTVNENFAGDNLVAIPKLTNKISIAYSVRAKKVDMRQLKKSIWKCLISSNDTETINIKEMVEQETANTIKEDKPFSQVYKELPNLLIKTNVDALSFPISFVSLLHLANEKTLSIQSLPDMSDIIVAAN